MLGVYGDPSVTGKPAGDDLREGKHTLLTALAMEAANGSQAAALRAGLGNRTLDEAQVAALREVIIATGALEQVEQRIAVGTARARAALDSPAVSAESRAALDGLALAATNRHA